MAFVEKADDCVEETGVIRCLRHQLPGIDIKVLFDFFTALPRFRLFGSSAFILGAWPIFMYLTLLTPTYFAQLPTGTSRTDMS